MMRLEYFNNLMN